MKFTWQTPLTAILIFIPSGQFSIEFVGDFHLLTGRRNYQDGGTGNRNIVSGFHTPFGLYKNSNCYLFHRSFPTGNSFKCLSKPQTFEKGGLHLSMEVGY